MPNYKECRFCSEKYVPLRDEIICLKCGNAVVYAVQMPVGEAIAIGELPIKAVKEIKDALTEAIMEAPLLPPEPEVEVKIVEVVKEVKVEVVEASPVDLQKEKDIKDMEEAVVELAKEETAELIAPSAPKPDVPEEKPDAPS